MISLKRGVRITPSALSGSLNIMPSKSVSHRAAICAALSGGSVVKNLGLSEDIMSTRSALTALGFGSELSGSELRGSGPAKAALGERFVECGESGSTLRLLLPLSLDGVPTRFTGKGRLMSRPMEPYADMFCARGITISQTQEGIDVSGTLAPGRYSLRGDVSSQFVSGLMFALPRLDGDSVVELTSPLESRSYVELTMRVLRAFGVEVGEGAADGLAYYQIPGGQSFSPASVEVEGDYSHAAFWLVAGALGGGTALSGLDMHSAQGDAAIIGILKNMNADIRWIGDQLHVRPSRLRGARIDISQTPDIFPILSVAACAAEGETVLFGGSRLRVKESDRLAAMAEALAKLGARVEENDDSLHIMGCGRLSGGAVSARADHRVAMSVAVAASICERKVIIDDADCVNKSAPGFWDEYASAGGYFRFESGEF